MKYPNLSQKYQNYKKKNIALIGHMGSGKSLIGKLIANRLSKEHIDSDKEIEKKMENSIQKIFETLGETKFRQIEEKVILSLKNKKNIVLSLGGGSILSNKVRHLLNNQFITLFLDVDFKILANRLYKSDKRPLLSGVNIEKKLKELDKSRRKYYLLADITTSNFDNPKDTVNIFFDEYNKLNEKNN